jgi:hypothetical protein
VIDFKPSQVNPQHRYRPREGESWLPFVAGFGQTEREVAAALLVRTCAVRGDQRQAVSWEEAIEVLKADVAAKIEPLYGWCTSPMIRPDVYQLVEKGFARWVGVRERIEFTAKGFDVLRDFVKEPS